ncbi:response regulator [Massilia consociata]|uniref:Response regulator n=1 Tax=Massilia consociata TaxID=760117 RepID=A0ABV6FIF6_9BURK
MNKDCKHILIVDDAATVRMYHRSILEEAGYAATEAANGLEALEKTMTADFDLYLVDVNMPQMDGYGFLRALRGRGGAQAPAIMVSTEAEDGDRRLALAAGANHYLAKPVRPQQLLRIVTLLLGGQA